jgi:hypothetical protein
MDMSMNGSGIYSKFWGHSGVYDRMKRSRFPLSNTPVLIVSKSKMSMAVPGNYS